MTLTFISAGFLLVIIYTAKKMYYTFKYWNELEIDNRTEIEKRFYSQNKYFVNVGISLILIGIFISLIYKP